jgi:hypothetical protein
MNVMETKSSLDAVKEENKVHKDWIVVEEEEKEPPVVVAWNGSQNNRRTSTGGPTTGGLSELSKQLRSLQAKNQSQLLEIDRLQRQLRILADLEDVSVADLRDALAKACEAEAYGEMHLRLAGLRAELEAITLANADAASAVRQDAANAKVIANLELRIGELEELDDKHRGEIEQLYNQLTEQQANSTRLESLCEQLRCDNEQLKMNNQNTALRQEAHSTLEQNRQAESFAAMTRARDAEMEARILSEKIQISEKQRDAAERESSLRNAQFKARFMVQDENIEDLRQQLSSLYAAFELLKEEKDRDDAVRCSLQALLGHADAEVARQVDEIDQSNQSFLSPSTHSNRVLGTGNVVTKSPQEKRTSSTIWRQNSDITALMSGDLLIKASTGVIKKWKKRYVRLFVTESHFHLDIGEEKGYAIQIGISRIELYPKYPFGFTIYMGGRSGCTLIAAANNEKDFDDWISVLMFATTGKEAIEDESFVSSPVRSSRSSERSIVVDDNSTERKPTLAEQEESDLELALEMSRRELNTSQRGFS